MTKKDYQKFATMLRNAKELVKKVKVFNLDQEVTLAYRDGLEYMLENIQNDMIAILSNDNPNFSQLKFTEWVNKQS